MKHCQIAYSILKTIFYEANKKSKCNQFSNTELVNMEDIIPIFILVLLMSEIPNLKAQLDLVIDFIEYDQCDLESEKRLLLNFSVPLSLFRNHSIIFIEIGRYDFLMILIKEILNVKIFSIFI